MQNSKSSHVSSTKWLGSSERPISIAASWLRSFRSTISTSSRLRSPGLLSVALIAGLLLLGGCSGLQRAVKIDFAPVEMKQPPQKPPLPDPRPLDPEQVKWKVLTPKTLPEGEDWVYFALTSKQYEALARNIADMIRWAREAKWRLRYYRGEGKVDGR